VLFTVNKPKQPRYQVFILGLRHHDTIVGSPAYMTYWTFPIDRSTYVVRAWGNERDLAGSPALPFSGGASHAVSLAATIASDRPDRGVTRRLSQPRPCRFESCRGHVKELQNRSVIDRRLLVEASFSL
jgi:hypothetical protein